MLFVPHMSMCSFFVLYRTSHSFAIACRVCPVTQSIMLNLKDEKPTIEVQLLSEKQRPGVCEDLLQLLQQRGNPAPQYFAAAASIAHYGPRQQLYAWAVLEAPDRLCIITDELPSQQQSWAIDTLLQRGLQR